MVLFSLGMMISLFLLPENILDYSTVLRNFVNEISFFPSIKRIGKYSEFPQIAQLIYSAALLSIPFITIAAYKYYSKNHSAIDSGTLGPKVSRTAGAIIGLIMGLLGLISVLTIFPGAPGGRGSYFVTYSYYSKICFSFSTGIFVGAASIPFGFAIYCISSRHKYK